FPKNREPVPARASGRRISRERRHRHRVPSPAISPVAEDLDLFEDPVLLEPIEPEHLPVESFESGLSADRLLTGRHEPRIVGDESEKPADVLCRGRVLPRREKIPNGLLVTDRHFFLDLAWRLVFLLLLAFRLTFGLTRSGSLALPVSRFHSS